MGRETGKAKSHRGKEPRGLPGGPVAKNPPSSVGGHEGSGN